MEIEFNLLTYLASNDFINFRKLRKFIDNKIIEQFLNLNFENKSYKYCNHMFTKGKYKATYCFAKTFNNYTDKCKLHNKDYKNYKKNNLQEMNQVINTFCKYFDSVNEINKDISFEDKPSAPKIDEIIELNNSPPVYEQKPDESGKSIINEINNSSSIDIQNPLLNNKNNKSIKINYNKIFNEVKLYNKNESLNLNDNKYKLILCNKELEEQYYEISKFMTKYDFLSPLILDGNNPIDTMDKKSYTNKLLNLRLTDYPNFRGKQIQELARTIVTFQFNAYTYSLFGKPVLTNNVIKVINQFIQRIPK